MPERILDGNAEQVRLVVDQLASTIIEKLSDPEKGKLVDFHNNKQFHEWLDERVDNRNRKTLVSLALAYLIPTMIGGTVVYAKLDQALQSQQQNTVTLYSRGQFIRDQQDFNCRLVSFEEKVHGPDAREILPCRFQSADDPRDVRR